MATFALTDYSFDDGGTDLSAWVQSISLTVEGDALDDTAMGDTYRSRIGGLKDWSVSVTFTQDHAASAPDATLFSGIGGTSTLTLKPTSGAVSATNPSFSGTALLRTYGPIDGSVGDLALTRAEYDGAGTLTRATS